MAPAEWLVRIDAPYACFGLLVRERTVVKAPPIARWTLHKNIDNVLAFYRARGARITRLD